MSVRRGGDTPNVLHGGQKDYKDIYFQEEGKLVVPVSLQAGYGTVEAGTVIAENTSAAGNDGKFVPYDPDATITGTEENTGRANLVQNTGGATSDLYVTIPDSYKFAVGDDVFIEDDTTAEENLRAITAIDRTTYTHMAKITITTQTGGTSFTTARFAYINVEGAKTAKGILERTVDTGVGSTAKGALGVILVANAVLYTGMLNNLDTNAKSDLANVATFGRYTILK